MKNKISIFLAYDIPPAIHECPHKISAKSVQPFGRLYTTYIRMSHFIIQNNNNRRSERATCNPQTGLSVHFSFLFSKSQYLLSIQIPELLDFQSSTEKGICMRSFIFLTKIFNFADKYTYSKSASQKIERFHDYQICSLFHQLSRILCRVYPV